MSIYNIMHHVCMQFVVCFKWLQDIFKKKHFKASNKDIFRFKTPFHTTLWTLSNFEIIFDFIFPTVFEKGTLTAPFADIWRCQWSYHVPHSCFNILKHNFYENSYRHSKGNCGGQDFCGHHVYSIENITTLPSIRDYFYE